jgi:hypothetical protein
MFATAMKSKGKTWNNAESYETPDPSLKMDGRLSLFFKTVRGISESQIENYMNKASDEDIIDTFILSFYTRDPRGGKGERSIGRYMFKWLAENYPEKFFKVLKLIPEYGRWDDILTLVPNSSVLDSTLQDNIVKLYVIQLKTDKALMGLGEPISIAAKWAPTEGDSDDRKYNLVETLCKELGISKREYRKEYITPLRTYLDIVEIKMCTNKWDEINFNKVPSCAIKRLKKAFEKNTPEKFLKWRKDLKSGVNKVNAKVLHPHELVKEMNVCMNCDEVTEQQWKVLVKEVEKLGILENSVAVVDTSGSMTINDGLPLYNAIALGMIISEVTKEPFKNNVITFDDNPKFVHLNTNTLFERFTQIRNMDWGMSTNIQGVFDLILQKGEEHSLKQEDMPEKIFIISDMQFNNCGTNTNLEEIDIKYSKYGYKRPQIIFWNVNGSIDDFPTTVDKDGTCLVSGSSPSILKSILSSEEFNSDTIMRETLNDKRYEPIKELLI